MWLDFTIEKVETQEGKNEWFLHWKEENRKLNLYGQWDL